ncbi:hypothetical protein GOODEAATRI_030679 [Goodea atripinnis]|uniref:Uncharacterized protein n=1 Tax=Goodea atripinnis TaxID=208336 RepID=A0ABV0PT13_9TELE
MDLSTTSPAQLLMSRRLRSILPSTDKQLKPELVCQCSPQLETTVSETAKVVSQQDRVNPTSPDTVHFQLPKTAGETGDTSSEHLRCLPHQVSQQDPPFCIESVQTLNRTIFTSYTKGCIVRPRDILDL